MATITSRSGFKDYCLRRLGFPVIEINVDPDQIEDRVDDAMYYYTQYHMDATDRYYFTYGFTNSSETTLASAAQKYNSDLEIFNVDLFYLNGKIRADLMYPTKYAVVNFYQTAIGATYSIGTTKQTVERIVEVSETLDWELNYDYSKNKCPIKGKYNTLIMYFYINNNEV